MDSLNFFNSPKSFKDEVVNIIDKTIIISKEQKDDSRVSVTIDSDLLKRIVSCNAKDESIIVDDATYNLISTERLQNNCVRIIIKDRDYGFYFSAIVKEAAGYIFLASDIDKYGARVCMANGFDTIEFEKNYPVPYIKVLNLGVSEIENLPDIIGATD